MKPIKHGSRTGYQNGCRCDSCKGANADYIRQSRAGKIKTKAYRETEPEFFPPSKLLKVLKP
jgi:hypothetical protein